MSEPKQEVIGIVPKKRRVVPLRPWKTAEGDPAPAPEGQRIELDPQTGEIQATVTEEAGLVRQALELVEAHDTVAIENMSRLEEQLSNLAAETPGRMVAGVRIVMGTIDCKGQRREVWHIDLTPPLPSTYWVVLSWPDIARKAVVAEYLDQGDALSHMQNAAAQARE